VSDGSASAGAHEKIAKDKTTTTLTATPWTLLRYTIAI